jgi:V8-like Glu-specific endopeptidase
MRRISFLVCAVVLTALLIPVAGVQAKGGPAEPRQKDVRQSRADVLSYWTKKRMRNATPLKVTIKSAPTATGSAAPAGEAGSVDAVAPFRAGTSTNATKDGSVLQMTVDYAFAFDRYEVAPPYTEFPKSTHGKVFFTDPSTGTNYVCSGTALSSENMSVVWTAGHCVNGGGGPWYTNWMFAPARRDGSNPYGTFAARELWSITGWASGGDTSYDLGAAVVNASGGSLLVDAVGGRGISWNAARNQNYAAHGYPAAPPFRGERQIVCESPWGGDDIAGAGPPTMRIDCDMTGGSSGGGWIVGGNVHSVNSYKYIFDRKSMYGPYHGQGAADLYNAVRNR